MTASRAVGRLVTGVVFIDAISFLEPTQPDVIQKILTHCGLADEPPRAPSHAPPPKIRGLRRQRRSDARTVK